MTGSGLGIDRHKDFHGLIITAGQRARAVGGWQTYGPVIGVGLMNR